MSKRKTQIISAWGVMAALALLYLLSPAFRGAVQRALALLSGADVEAMRDYLLSFGAWAPVISACLMVLQALVLPVPSFVLTLANGLLFGTVWGALLSWSSAMVAAVLCYYISRLFGRPLVVKLVGERPLDLTDRFFQRYGKHAVLIARLIPGISFDVVSYAAGLSSIGLWGFVLATGIGQMPGTIVFSFLGETVPQAARVGLWILVGVMVLVTLGLALRSRLEEGLLSE
ncbi:MAG: TVP38/TMEM64 family protein [Anaerolineae bacterium]|nr:TVP38/TMEM64 family protein [Anaerolineae bacterium]